MSCEFKEELSRTRILIYQYTMFKADRLRFEALKATEKLKYSKKLTPDELYNIHRALLRDELFEEFETELFKMLDL